MTESSVLQLKKIPQATENGMVHSTVSSHTVFSFLSLLYYLSQNTAGAQTDDVTGT